MDKLQGRGVLVAAVVLGALATARVAATKATPQASMAQAANAFLESLTPAQKKDAAFSLKAPAREQWHYVPGPRPGVRLKDMSPRQKDRAFALMKAGLSQMGFEKGKKIIHLEAVLAQLENNPVKRDPELYYVSIYGKPAPHGTWGWKFEGHHLSLNFLVVKGQFIATTPTFMGANPARIPKGPLKGQRALSKEEDLAREVMASLPGQLRSQAIISKTAPPEILTEAKSRVEPLEPVGLKAEAMPAPAREKLEALIHEYVAAMPPTLARQRLGKIQKGGFGKIGFAWAGSLKPGEAHYYRIQGPSFLLEYDNFQNGANHLHTVWRDFDGDFGRDLLAEHYRDRHSDKGPAPAPASPPPAR